MVPADTKTRTLRAALPGRHFSTRPWCDHPNAKFFVRSIVDANHGHRAVFKREPIVPRLRSLPEELHHSSNHTERGGWELDQPFFVIAQAIELGGGNIGGDSTFEFEAHSLGSLDEAL